jgi:hypothetical protein
MLLRFILSSMFVFAIMTLNTVFGSELDPDTGLLKSVDSDAIMIGFEDAAKLAEYGVALTKYQKGGGYGYGAKLVFVNSDGAPITQDDLIAHKAADQPVEGANSLLLGYGPSDGARGILVPFAKIDPLLTKPQIIITLWVRTNGATPNLTVTYGSGTLPLSGTFVSVTAIRTGRETSDGWAELTTGPIDRAIWGVPIAQITAGTTGSGMHGNTEATIVIDALEIVPVDGKQVSSDACTIASQQEACGGDGECQFGHCVPAYASWGPTPDKDDRQDIIDRWIAIAKYVHGARNVQKNAEAMVQAKPFLTVEEIGGREFHAGMIGLVNGLRNHHTSIGSPANQGLLQPLAAGGSSSTLGVCIGFGQLDLLADPPDSQAPPGFIVYKTAKTSLVGASLSPGDAITKIDGIDPLTWVRSVYLTYAAGVPADPEADLAWSSAGVAWMISHRASTVEITHCASASDCTGENKKIFEIDVAGPAWKNLEGTGMVGNEDDENIIACSVRFQNTLEPSGGGNKGDKVTTGTVFSDILGIQFNGTLSDFADWQKQVVPAFSTDPLPSKILFDVRQGNGGYAENAALIAEEIRDLNQPVGYVGFPAACWDGSCTVADLLNVLATADPQCNKMSLETLQSSPCDLIVEEYFLGDYYAQAEFLEKLINPETPITEFKPGGIGAKVAWLQAADVSANDYLAALVQGRTSQKIFAPGHTSGSFGTISSIGQMLLGWRGGSIQMTDSLWGTDVSSFQTSSFHSGAGIPPDEIIGEKMSDAINGVDTMITAAVSWLNSSD